MNKQLAEKLFIDIAEQYEDVYEIKDRLRGLNSNNKITDEEYDYILQEWDNLLAKHNL